MLDELRRGGEKRFVDVRTRTRTSTRDGGNDMLRYLGPAARR
jgi:hypothetical protein